LDRPEKIRGVDVPMNHILINAIERLKVMKVIREEDDPIIFQTHVTNPFLSRSTIQDALQNYYNTPNEEGTTMMSVTKHQKRLWTEDTQPINHRVSDLCQTQDLEPIYEENSNFYIFRASTLQRYNNRIGPNKLFYPMNILEAWDIDTEDDFQIAQIIHKKFQSNPPNPPNPPHKTLTNSANPSNPKQKTLTNSNQSSDSGSSKLNINQTLLNELRTTLKPEIEQYLEHPQSIQPTVLISAPYMMKDIKTFESFYNGLGINVIVADVEERLSAKDLEQYHGRYQVSLCGDDAFTENIIRESGVKAICKWGTGIDSIDLEYCRKVGIPVLNTPNAFSVPVSQSIIAAILGFARTTFHSNQEMKGTNRWVKYQGYTLEELTIGIVGLGNIGRHVAEGLNFFRPRILGYDINPNLPAIPWVTNTTNLESLLRESDIVCLCTTLNPSSYHLINHHTIHQIKKGAYLINMARGPLVEESALVEAIKQGHISGAALDVFEVEPLPEQSQLRHLPNVLISSHNTNSSPKYWMKVHTNTIRNSLRALSENQYKS
jgi:D-3-phosphoglycerate dehydrogenase